jgi:hypothetical protein
MPEDIMATIGEILDEFFSPFGTERLWVMPESDKYTQIVRAWKPVIDAVAAVKAHLEANCSTWSSSYRTSPTWKPGKTDPPITDPNAVRVFSPSPPGTDPGTCMQAFAVYVTTKVARQMSRLPMPMVIPLPIPEVQTYKLYTCSIGSFNIYATVDSVDCAARSATMNVWMFNCMSQKSFGKFASNPVFAASKMEKQYMWWNWKEVHNWGSASTPSAPRPQSGTVHW